MSVQSTIETKLSNALAPNHLEVLNESHMHSVPPGSESHFKLIIVSDAFDGASRVARHQKVNGVLADELSGVIHALSMETYTADEWEKREGRTLASPACHGGSKRDS